MSLDVATLPLLLLLLACSSSCCQVAVAVLKRYHNLLFNKVRHKEKAINHSSGGGSRSFISPHALHHQPVLTDKRRDTNPKTQNTAKKRTRFKSEYKIILRTILSLSSFSQNHPHLQPKHTIDIFPCLVVQTTSGWSWNSKTITTLLLFSMPSGAVMLLGSYLSISPHDCLFL